MVDSSKQSMSKEQPIPPANPPTKPKKQPGPPPLTLHIDDKPENVAKALFGIKSDTPGKVTVKRG